MTLQPPLIVDVDSWNENGAQSEADDEKRKCLHVSLHDKLKHIERLNNGESAKKIAGEIGLSPATVRRWRHSKDDLQRFDIENRKRARTGANPRLDEAVFAWYEEQRAQGIPVTGAALKGKATEFNKRMSGDPRFTASDGWLSRWRTRNIANPVTVEDNPQPIKQAPVTSEEKFSRLLQTEMKLNSSQVFNVAMTTLNPKLLPIKPTKPGCVGWTATIQDRLTIMVCSNVDSTLKLRLLVIGKSAQPRGLKNVQQLTIPICYTHQENALMNSQIFGDWFVNEFAPSVSTFLNSKKIPAKALLLLDETDPCSPDLAIGGARTMLVPPNTILSATTAKHKVAEDLKRRYRLGLLESLSDAQDKGHDPILYIRNLGMKDIIFRLDAAWIEVSQQTIIDSWCNFMPPLEPLESDPLALDESIVENVILKLLRKVVGNVEITEKLAIAWVRDLQKPTQGHKVEMIDLMEAEEEKQRRMFEEKVISPTEAVEALNSVIYFFERHGRLSAVELAALRTAREAAQSEQINYQK